MTFILNARYFLVTYPQCDGLDEWAVNDHFGSLGAECIVAREDHADGGTHLHVFCDFGRKFRSRRPNIFDVDGFHPNIERSKKNPRKGAHYATKDGDIVAGGLAIPQLPTRLLPTAQDPGSTLVCAESQREFFEFAEDICPWDLITKFGSMHAYAKWRWPELGEPYESPPGITIADGAFPDLVEWRTRAMEHGGESYTFFIIAFGGIVRVEVASSTGICRGTLRVPTTPNKSPVRGVCFHIGTCLLTKHRRTNQVSSSYR